MTILSDCHCKNSSLWEDGPVDMSLCTWNTGENTNNIKYSKKYFEIYINVDRQSFNRKFNFQSQPRFH